MGADDSRLWYPLRLVALNLPFGSYFDASVKALVALALSAIWLFVWDRQVRFYFYRRPT